MADTSNDTRSSAPAARAGAKRPAGLASSGKNGLAAPGDLAMTMTEAWARMVAEGAAFVAERVRADARAFSQAMTCRTPTELQDVQAAFVQKAMEDYQAEAGRMASLMEEAVSTASGRSRE